MASVQLHFQGSVAAWILGIANLRQNVIPFRAKGKEVLQRSLAKLCLSDLLGYRKAVQQQAYLGNNEDLLEYMRCKGIMTMTTKAVRTWLRNNDGFPDDYLHNNLQLEDCDIDHILPRSVGGQDHPFNYFVLPKRLNGSLNGWWTPQKQVLLGREVSRTAKNFFIWVKEEGMRLGVNPNNFHQHRYSM